eukprot:Em0019g837a
MKTKSSDYCTPPDATPPDDTPPDDTPPDDTATRRHASEGQHQTTDAPPDARTDDTHQTRPTPPDDTPPDTTARPEPPD